MLNIINSPTNRNRVAPNSTPPNRTPPNRAPPPPPASAPASAPIQSPSSRNNLQINTNVIMPLASYSPTPFTYDEPPVRRSIDYLSSQRNERLRRSRSLTTSREDNYNYVTTNGSTINRLARIRNRLNRDRKQTQLATTPLSPRLIIKTKIVECAICQNKIEDKNVVITKCDHAFCASCMFKNIRYNNKCPLCREVITLPPIKKYNLSPELIEHVIHQQITLHEDRLKNTISTFINEHINNLNDESEAEAEPLLDDDEIMDITVKILESMSIFSTGVCRNIAQRIENFNNSNE
tara:strand:+ start:65 stop:943 length:879 start_codon:yes stop_codon:yes gene_type:complete